MTTRESPGRTLTRRGFHRLGASFLLAVTSSGLVARRVSAEGDRLVTEIPANQPMLGALQYVNQSTKPDQHCASCVLFQPASEGRGHCGLFREGLVSAQGWCASWSKKPG
jgi:High potential iron-sulfur protein